MCFWNYANKILFFCKEHGFECSIKADGLFFYLKVLYVLNCCTGRDQEEKSLLGGQNVLDKKSLF